MTWRGERWRGGEGRGGEGRYQPKLNPTQPRYTSLYPSLQPPHPHPSPSHSYAVVEEETRLVNSTTYGTRRLAPAKWADGDCALFFAALACFGTDFSLIAMLFPEMQVGCFWGRAGERDLGRV